MPRILITGANSFIGTNFRRFSQFKEVDEISLIDVDPRNIDFSRYDVVLNLAAIVHQSKRISEDDYFNVNRDLCLLTAENAKKAGVRQFIFLSTAKVYGQFIPGSAPWTEDSPCHPEDAYGRSKYEAEQALRKLQTHRFNVAIIRTPLVYGDGVKANMLSLIRLVSKLRILPFEGIQNKRAYTFTENLIGFIDRIIKKKSNGVFIAMDDDLVSTTFIIKQIAFALDCKIILLKLPDILKRIGWKILPGYFDKLFGSIELDNTRTKGVLDFHPQYTTAQGIKRMIESLKKK